MKDEEFDKEVQKLLLMKEKIFFLNQPAEIAQMMILITESRQRIEKMMKDSKK